ncbi:MAG: hypoxanthine phosphoribosyltransferase [Acidimicrobiaceae bacterium]|nr:hypoxanthine phosphoribosyltransferase [Acidimicrobiaceae bacterium]
MAPRVLIPADVLQAGVARLGAEVSADHPDGVVLVSVLKGSVPFMADLVRRVSVPVEVDFLAVSKYAEGTGRVRMVKDLDIDICGRPVVVVEDVVDTGLTLTWLLGVLRARNPSTLRVCALLDKAIRRIVPTPVDYVGFQVEDDFLLGYGLDFAEVYRNVDHVVAGDLAALSGDRSAHVEDLYPG